MNRIRTRRARGSSPTAPRRLRRWLPIAAWVLLGGCQGQLYEATLREGTPASCLRFLEKHPAGVHAGHVRQLLDRRQFEQARAADSPLGYRAYLRAEPAGRHVAAANQRLGELALARADNDTALTLVLERYGETPAGAVASRRLADSLAAAAVSCEDVEQIETFLRAYPDHSRAAEARTRLAALRYEGLQDTIAELDEYVHEFGDTRWGALVQRRLRTVMVREIEQTGDRRLLDQLAVRFPGDPLVAQLRRTVDARRRWQALVAMNLDELEVLAAEAPEGAEAAVLGWCQQREIACTRLRRLSEAAGPWQASASLDELEHALYEADVAQGWRAMEQLSWTDGGKAGELLYQMLGSQRLSSAWAAEATLGAWLIRLNPEDRRRWTETQLQRTPREVNEDELQRWGYLRARVGRAGRGIEHLRKLAATPGRALSAGFLLSRLGRRDVEQGLVVAIDARVAQLKKAFPQRLNSDSVPAATLMERDLFAMVQVLQGIAGAPGTVGAATARSRRLLGTCRALLGSWRVRLARASSGFVAAKVASIAPTVAAHRRNRGSALDKLLARKGRPERLVAEAACALIALEATGARGDDGKRIAPMARRCRKAGRTWK